MTYYRGERSPAERYPRLSGGTSENQQPSPRSRSSTTASSGVVVHSCRTGQAVHGGTTVVDARVNSTYPRTRSTSESTVAGDDACCGGVEIVVNPAFLNACRDGDDNRLRQLMTSRTLTPDMVNCKDKTGKTGVNLICANGNFSLLQLISSIPTLDINLGDNEGNTPLHFASQAGHVEVLHFLLTEFKNLQIDSRNNLGFTALMKASLQGRTKCVKLLLTAGASSVLRDHGRGFCAYEWARFCTRQACAEVIEKFMKSCNHSPTTLRKQLKDLEKWNSEPNLQFFNVSTDSKDSWLKQKLKRALFNRQSGSSVHEPSRRSPVDNYSVMANLTNVALCASSPIVPTASNIKHASGGNDRNSCSNGDVARQPVPVPKLQVTDFNSTSTSTSSRNLNYS